MSLWDSNVLSMADNLPGLCMCFQAAQVILTFIKYEYVINDTPDVCVCVLCYILMHRFLTE